MKGFTEILRKIGFRNFLKYVAFVTNPVKVHGYIDSPPTAATPFTISQSGSMIASGWAILPDSREIPKIVFFSYGNNRLFFANAVINLDSPDIVKVFNSDQYSKSRWAVSISPKSLPLGETVIKAWAYNPSSKQFIKLSSEPKVKVVE